MAQINYQNKANINTSTTPVQNKVSADDMNEIKSVVNSNTPIGTISMYAGTSEPSGWLICDGRAVSRTTYADLFGVIGIAFGSGDGSTTFNIPDFRSNTGVGLDSRDSDFDTIGKTYGEKEHTLTIQEMPDHNHPLAINGGSSTGTRFTYTSDSQKRMYAGTDLIGNTGGGQSHNNVQPSVVVNYIISY